ncbi:modin [Colletotrichum camelliae]|nr:modin [Colletotrichum camelliae]
MPGSNELTVAIAALAIAIAALFAATLQIWQAIFASARGVSSCNKKVIGKWAKHTKWRPKLTQLGLEVSFEAPVIFLAPQSQIKGPVDAPVWQAMGTRESCEESRTEWKYVEPKQDTGGGGPKELVHTVENEQATWIWLLAATQRMEKESKEWETKKLQDDLNSAAPGATITKSIQAPTLTVKIQAKRRSFDSNPSIKKPYATTTISHIIELASALGLYWKVFDRDDNKYRAEGNGYSLTGSRIADFGIVFSFEKIGQPAFQERRVIPTYEVKELCFGRVPTLYRGPKETEDAVEWLKPLKTSSPDSLEILQLGSREEIAETLTQIGCNVNTILLYKKEQNDKHLFSVTFEMMGMLARVFHIKDRCFRFLPNPTIFPWTKDSFSLLRLLTAFDLQLERDLLDIHEMISEEFEGEDDIDFDVRAELKQIRELARIAQKLSDDFKQGAKLTYFRMNDLHEAIRWTDEILKGKDHLIVRDVLRRHLQEVLAAVNNQTVGGKRNRGSKSQKGDSISFGDLLEVPLEMREQRFMETYFDRVLWQIISTNTKEGDQEEVSRRIHDASRRTREGNGKLEVSGSPHINVQSTGGSPTKEGHEIPSPGLVHQATWPPRTSAKDPGGEDEGAPSWAAIAKDADGMQRLTVWYILVFRMVCWLTLHDFDKKDIQVPKSELIGNRQPVFIM